MPVIEGRQSGRRCLIDVLFWLSDREVRRRGSSPLPKPIPAVALIDTGASKSCVHIEHLATTLGLTPVDTEPVYSSTTGRGRAPKKPIYHCGLRIPVRASGQTVNHVLPDLRVFGLELDPFLDQFSVLIGTDILAGCDFHLRGAKQEFSLAF